MRVKTIAFAGTADVYNMEVEETHSFAVQGGIIVHNCYDQVRYAVMSRPITPQKPPESLTDIQRHKRKKADRRKQSNMYRIV